jgi:hypothetical protein
MIVSHIITLWITFGSLTVEKPPIQLLPLSTAGCTNDSYTHIVSPAEIVIPDSQYHFEWANHSISEEPLYNYSISKNISSDIEEAVFTSPGSE